MATGPISRAGLAVMLTLGAVAATLAGCTPSTSPAGSTTSGSSGLTSAPTSASTTSPKTSATTTTSAGAATSAPAAATSTGTGKCLAGQLTATLGAGAGGSAGHQNPYLVLTNKGSTTCTLRGYPGVSFVGNGSGAQLGAAASRDASGIAVATVTLAPGASAHSQLSITNAGNYDAATCNPKVADGLRVYPPDETSSLFVATTSYTACQKTTVVIIQVRPLQTGAA